MTRGIQLKQLSAADLGYLGLPLDLLEADLRADLRADDSDLSMADPDAPVGVPEPRNIAREVRVCLEQTLALLTAALPAERRPHPRGERALGREGSERSERPAVAPGPRPPTSMA
ncbi:MAG: hypothetical protein EA400_06745 [Chromatiaceae bacterium]|nr:MAG: hypothetical protein EA400_06745 [Chromatiaceae bacterium]